jgi:hypothetical protein
MRVEAHLNGLLPDRTIKRPALLPPYTTGIVPIHIKLGVQPEGGNGEL